MEEFSAVVAEYHEAEEEAKRQGRYDEEVDGRDIVTVSSEEGPPGRRRVTGGATHVLGDGEGGDFIAEEAELGLNPAPAPAIPGGYGPCVEESAIGLIANMSSAAPYEELRLKGK